MGGWLPVRLRRRLGGLLLALACALALVVGGPVAHATPVETLERAQEAAAEGEARFEQDLAVGQEVASVMAHVLGIGVAPILGMAVIGAWDDFSDDPNASWHASPWFYVPLLLLLALIVAKDVFGIAMGPLKAPVDALEVLANKAGGGVGLAVSMTYAANSVGHETGVFTAQILGVVVPRALAGEGGGAVSASGVGVIAVVLAALAAGVVYTAVWVAGSCYSIAIFLNPFSFLDPVLKSLRGAGLLGVLVLCVVFPPLGILVCLLCFALAFLTFGPCLRFAVYGTVMAWDTVFGRRRGGVDAPDGLLCFSDVGMDGVPRRSMGRVAHDGSALVFTYRPLMVLPARTLTIENARGLRKGVLYTAVYAAGPSDGEDLLQLPPRYLSHEEAILHRLRLVEQCDSRLLGGFKGAVAWLRSLFRRGAAASA